MFDESSCLIRILSTGRVVMSDEVLLSELICDLAELPNLREYLTVLF